MVTAETKLMVWMTRVTTPFSGERTVFSTNDAGKMDIDTQKSEVRLLTLYTKTNSKWIKDINVIAKAINSWNKMCCGGVSLCQ